MASRKGIATIAPRAPRRNVRRGRCFCVMYIATPTQADLPAFAKAMAGPPKPWRRRKGPPLLSGSPLLRGSGRGRRPVSIRQNGDAATRFLRARVELGSHLERGAAHDA